MAKEEKTPLPPHENHEVEHFAFKTLPPHQIAFVYEGVVQDVINMPDRSAALLLSNPIIVNSTGVNLVVGETEFDEKTGEFIDADGTRHTPTPVPFKFR